jgi:hypothetical protein
MKTKEVQTVEVGGFIYGVSNEAPKGDVVLNYQDTLHPTLYRLKENEIHTQNDIDVLFSNNPDIKELPFLILPDKEDAKFTEQDMTEFAERCVSNPFESELKESFIAGYESNPAKFTEQDMIEFAEWCESNYSKVTGGKWKGHYFKLFVSGTDENDAVYDIYFTNKELVSLYIKSKERVIASVEVEIEENPYEEYENMPTSIGGERWLRFEQNPKFKVNEQNQITPTKTNYR